MKEQIFEVNCGFFDSINKDRLYSAEEMNKPLNRVITNGVFATNKGKPGTDLQVVSANDGMNIIVKKGQGMFGDKWFENPAEIAITVPENTSIVPRRDSVIVQIDKTQSGRKGSIVYRAGTASSDPQPPNIGTKDNVIEYRLANIYVAAGTIQIGQDVISDLRGSSECPWVTGLLEQVDTSALFNQWQTAYNDYYTKSTHDFDEYKSMHQEAFDEFMRNLTSELSVATSILMLTNNFISSEEIASIPIGIPSYNSETDVLEVFINGIRATEGYHYEIAENGSNIDLKVPLNTGQAVNFLVMKSVISSDIETTTLLIKELNKKIDDFTNDSGWINLLLENDILPFDDENKPCIRNINNKVFVRGIIKNIENTELDISTLPIGKRPNVDHIYTSAALLDNEITSIVVLKITKEGKIKIISKTEEIPANALISLDTSFVSD